MADFTKLRALADRLIPANGRSLTLRKNSETPTDPSKPFRSNDTNHTEYTVLGVFVDYKETEIDGTHVQRGDRKVLIQVPVDSGTDVDARFYDEVIDRSERWHIISMKKIEPADKTILYIGQLRG